MNMETPKAIGEFCEAQKSYAVSILLKLRCGDAVGVAKVYHDRIETWRNGELVGKARNLDDALRRAINAERSEMKRSRLAAGWRR